MYGRGSMEKAIIESKNLKLIVFSSFDEFGCKVDEHLVSRYGFDSRNQTFIVPIKENFFEDGHLKVEIGSTVRGTDLYMMTDIGNYSVAYKMHGFINHASPNDLMMELKDGIGAVNCHTKRLNIIMPLLYAGRQHRRISRESLTCGNNLRELDELNISSFITFDAHDPGVEHAIRGMEFDNVLPINPILERFIEDLDKEELKNIAFIAPDNGATGRRNVYLNSFSSDYINREAGSFIKQRDYNHFVDGKYPIISHDYCGDPHLEGKTAIISDDMISSGESMFEVIDELHKLGIAHIYLITTYALFTRGVDKFNEYYEKGLFDGYYTTNLSYIPNEYSNLEWLHVCDCSELVADVIYSIHNDLSLNGILRDRSYPVKLLERKFSSKK